MATGTAQLISTSLMISITDGLGYTHDLTDGARGTALTQAAKALGRVVGLAGTSYGLADKYMHADMDAGAQAFYDTFDEQTFWNNAASQILQGITNNANAYGRHVSTTIIDLDTYATYYNGQTAHSMTYSHAFARFYWLWKSKASMLTNNNVLSTSVTFGHATVTGTAALTFNDSAAITRVSTVAGGVQGKAADNFYLQMTAGSLFGTVTATGLNQTNGTVTWSAVIATALSAGTFAFTPATAGHRAYDLLGANYTGNGTTASFNIKTVSRAFSA